MEIEFDEPKTQVELINIDFYNFFKLDEDIYIKIEYSEKFSYRCFNINLNLMRIFDKDIMVEPVEVLYMKVKRK